MRSGALVCCLFFVVCLAGQPATSSGAAADSGSANFHRSIVHPAGPAPYFGPRFDSPLDTTRVHDTLVRRAGFVNPFLARFLTGASYTTAGHGRWREGLCLQNALGGDGYLYQNRSLKSDEYFPYDSRAVKTIGEAAGWVVPFFLPLYDREVLLPERFDPEPGRHGWPYR